MSFFILLIGQLFSNCQATGFAHLITDMLTERESFSFLLFSPPPPPPQTLLVGGYSEGTVGIQCGYSEDTVGIQSGYSQDTVGIQAGYSRDTVKIQSEYKGGEEEEAEEALSLCFQSGFVVFHDADCR